MIRIIRQSTQFIDCLVHLCRRKGMRKNFTAGLLGSEGEPDDS